MLSATIVTFGAMVGVIGSIGLVRHLGRPRGTDDSCTALTDPTCSKQYSELKADLVDRIAAGHFAADHSGIMLAEGERLLIRIPLVSYCARRQKDGRIFCRGGQIHRQRVSPDRGWPGTGHPDLLY